MKEEVLLEAVLPGILPVVDSFLVVVRILQMVAGVHILMVVVHLVLRDTLLVEVHICSDHSP